jgi:hypothetical protein
MFLLRFLRRGFTVVHMRIRHRWTSTRYQSRKICLRFVRIPLRLQMSFSNLVSSSRCSFFLTIKINMPHNFYFHPLEGSFVFEVIMLSVTIFATCLCSQYINTLITKKEKEFVAQNIAKPRMYPRSSYNSIQSVLILNVLMFSFFSFFL